MTKAKTHNNAVVLYSKNFVLFPNMVASILSSRDEDKKALQSLKEGDYIVVSSLFEDTGNMVANIFKTATKAKIIQSIKFDDGSIRIFFRGISKVKLSDIKVHKDGYLVAQVTDFKDIKIYDALQLEDVKNTLLNTVNNYSSTSKKLSSSLVAQFQRIVDTDDLVTAVLSHLPVNIKEKQVVLSKNDLVERISYVNSLIEVDLDLISVEKKIRDRVKTQMEKNQKDYYLNEQVKAIQKELNNGEELKDEIKELTDKLAKIKISKEGREKTISEIKKLSMMNPISAEASVVRNYIDWLINLPWNVGSSAKIDIVKAEGYLESEHHALNKVKERILEYLSVLKKSKNLKAPIICLVGPPGVGKTSLAKSIAKAAGREFTRISLGGVRDEAEIRGHRRTYIGAMPGKIIQSMKKVKVNNPLFLLDEIDKMGSDFRGDPASALLEVLDHEQNATFVDHYVEVEYDLSNVMFIATANSLNIQEALLDRMEIIHLSGYSEEEKLEIAKKHLLPRIMAETSVTEQEFFVSDDAIVELIRGYTKESGVRELYRVLSKVIRKSVKAMLSSDIKSVNVTADNYQTYAGIVLFKNTMQEQEDLVGVTNGLAWTTVGGDTLYVEAIKLSGKGDIKITGKLGEVMQESIKAAYSLLQSNAEHLGLSNDDFKNHDIHIHVPEGATPKDGPSAGVAMITSIYSCLSGKKVRKDVAMTGEITLRGRVLPIGGVREKLLAALRVGITNVIIPKDNEKDLADLPKNSLEKLNIIAVSNYLEVLDNSIVKTK